jgi:hypothetical protein
VKCDYWLVFDDKSMTHKEPFRCPLEQVAGQTFPMVRQSERLARSIEQALERKSL